MARLKFTLMGNALRKSVWQTIGVILGMITVLSSVIGATVGAGIGGWHYPALTGEIITLSGALLVACWWILPIFMFGVDSTMDPQRFVPYPISRNSLLAGLTASGLISVPGIGTALVCLGLIVAWIGQPRVIPAAILGAVLAIALCIIGSRAFTTLLSPLMESRRSREGLALIAMVLVMAISPLINWVAEYFSTTGMTVNQARLLVSDVSGVMGWTPLGAPWGVAESVYWGHWDAAAAQLGIVMVTLIVLWLVWGWALQRSLEHPPRQRTGTERAKGLGIFDRLPATPTGAVAARALTYWRRDPRYSGSIIAVIAMPIIMAVASQSGGGEIRAMNAVTAPMVGWMIGFSLANDVAFDDSAFALHVATGVSGRVDRWGRTLPVLTVGAPVVIGLSVLSAGLAGHWNWLPALMGLSLGMLASALGLAAATSARWLYPVPKPGESPFKQPQGAAGATLVAQGVSMGLMTVVTLP
ncbi:MAG: hypothetical protein LBH13_07340, partial [Cellulomonadaceae bacterium]|nr:hypothetical protein [Cellulomonadaceae bacterium]